MKLLKQRLVFNVRMCKNENVQMSRERCQNRTDYFGFADQRPSNEHTVLGLFKRKKEIEAEDAIVNNNNNHNRNSRII